MGAGAVKLQNDKTQYKRGPYTDYTLYCKSPETI